MEGVVERPIKIEGITHISKTAYLENVFSSIASMFLTSVVPNMWIESGLDGNTGRTRLIVGSRKARALRKRSYFGSCDPLLHIYT